MPACLSAVALHVPRLTRAFTTTHAKIFLRTEGRTFSHWFGTRILVLETVGRHSGKPRRVPLVYLRDGDDLVVVPANGGADAPPAWWLNLMAAGEAVAVLGAERWRVVPRQAENAERRRLWQKFARVTPVDRYQSRTSRPIPVVVLSPRP